MKKILENIIKIIKKHRLFFLVLFQAILFQVLGVIFIAGYGNKIYAKPFYVYMNIAVVLAVVHIFLKEVLNKRHKILDTFIYVIMMFFLLISLVYLYKIKKGAM